MKNDLEGCLLYIPQVRKYFTQFCYCKIVADSKPSYICRISSTVRHYQSMMDSDNLLKGQSYSELKESYVLLICLYDPFKQGLPVYTFKNTCEENPNATELSFCKSCQKNKK